MHFACAAIVDSPICVEMLIHRGAKVNVLDHKKNSPAMVKYFYDISYKYTGKYTIFNIIIIR